MIILSTKLRNSINRYSPKGNYEFHLKNISVNGQKRGCSGFIVNKDNGLIIYVDTEPIPWFQKPLMYRYAKSTSDWTGSVNRWTKDLDSLTREIVECLYKNKEVRS